MPLQILLTIGASFLFLLVEAILNLHRRSKSGSGTIRADKGSLFLIWFTITISFTVGFSLAEYGEWKVTNFIAGVTGIFLYFSGMVIRLLAVRQLDEAFTVDVAYKEGQKLNTQGLYGLVRHPSYLGGLMIIAGIALGMSTVISFLVVMIPVFLAFNYRINVEERLLLGSFGESYRQYKAATRKIIPFVY